MSKRSRLESRTAGLEAGSVLPSSSRFLDLSEPQCLPLGRDTVMPTLQGGREGQTQVVNCHKGASHTVGAQRCSSPTPSSIP